MGPIYRNSAIKLCPFLNESSLQLLSYIYKFIYLYS